MPEQVARRPRLLVLDVNETLSDMAPMAGRFADVGAPEHLASLWFAELLRDGFARTASGESEAFAVLGAEALRVRLHALELDRPLEEAVDHVMQGFSELAVHPDVVPGITALAEQGMRLVTLSNGSSAVAERLLTSGGVRDRFEHLLSVEDVGAWKPAAAAYAHALRVCDVAPADAMLVAVHPWDTDGAARAGLASAWIDRSGSGRYPAYFQQPDLVAGSFTDLAARLASRS